MTRRQNLRKLDFGVYACTPGPDKECNNDFQALMDYLGSVKFVTIYNTARVDAKDFE